MHNKIYMYSSMALNRLKKVWQDHEIFVSKMPITYTCRVKHSVYSVHVIAYTKNILDMIVTVSISFQMIVPLPKVALVVLFFFSFACLIIQVNKPHRNLQSKLTFEKSPVKRTAIYM